MWKVWRINNIFIMRKIHWGWESENLNTIFVRDGNQFNILGFFLFVKKRNFVNGIICSLSYRCPAYYNLPPQCTLTKKTGECCLQPVCNFNPQYQTQTGQKVVNVNGVSKWRHFLNWTQILNQLKKISIWV